MSISALTGEGCETLLATVGEKLMAGAKLYSFAIPADDGERLAFLHARGHVVSETIDEGDQTPIVRLQVRLSDRELGRFSAL